MGHSQFMQKSCTMAHVENPSPKPPFAMGRHAAVQLPQSGHWHGSAAISGCYDRIADKADLDLPRSNVCYVPVSYTHLRAHET